MATQPGPINMHVGLPASADLSTKQWYFGEVTTGKVTVCNAAGDYAIGVIQNKVAAADREVDLVIFGPTKIVAGAAITAGDLITTDANGKAVTVAPAAGGADANKAILGRAMEDATGDGMVLSAWVNCINPAPAK